jgi:hypothetical protein
MEQDSSSEDDSNLSNPKFNTMWRGGVNASGLC